ncbi:MAG: transposase [Legionellales bacterium]|nr:transposase [Legionellales bacterium]
MHYRRVIIPGATYFFTVNLYNRKSSLLINEVNLLRTIFCRVHHLHPFIINAIVILPDHLHAVFTLPENDSNYSLRWNLIKGYFSKEIQTKEVINASRKNKKERGIWQRRFWEHLIRNEHDLKNHIDYIHYNPVKHGYVQQPAQWKYSSIHQYIKNETISKDWSCSESSHLYQD